MNRFDELWTTGLDATAISLADRAHPPGDVAEIVALARRVNFPAALALLGGASANGETGDALFATVAREATHDPGLRSRGVDTPDVGRILRALFVLRTSPDA